MNRVSGTTTPPAPETAGDLNGRWQWRLSRFLWLVAIHSAGVGLALVSRPPQLMEWAGFSPDTESFFAVQNGVFHLVLAIGYAWGAWQPVRGRNLIVFTIVVKCAAAVFLLAYFFAVDAKVVILLSGAGDGMMAIVVALLLRKADRERISAHINPRSAPISVGASARSR